MPAPAALVSKLARAYGLSGLVPVEDARVRRLLQGAAEEVAEGGGVEFWVSEGWIQGPDGPLGDVEDLTGELARDLEIAGVGGVSLPAGVSVDALSAFVVHLREGAGSGDGTRTARALAHELSEIAVEFSEEGARAWGPARSLDRLFATPLEAPEEVEASGQEVEAPEEVEASGQEVEAPEEVEAPRPEGEPPAPEAEAPPAEAQPPAAPAEPSLPGTAAEKEAATTPPEPEPAEAPEPAAPPPSAPPGDEGPPSRSPSPPPGAGAPGERDDLGAPTEPPAAPSQAVSAEGEPAGVPGEGRSESEAPAAHAEPSLPETAAEEEAPTAPPEPELAQAGDAEEGPELHALVAEYLQAPSGERSSVEERIRARAEALRQAGAFDEVAAGVKELARAGIEEPGDAGALELAREILVPGAATRIALDLGEVREEEERAAMIDLVARLGKSMAAPLAEALSDAGDRSARRAYIETMVAMGGAVEDVVLGMVDDSRWFVVRNGVGILGRIGGDRAIEHLTSTLGHEDLRVRRETVIALAKVGGEDAAALVLGMIDDSEPEVRAAVAMALGELGVERAVRPLRRRLEEEEEEDVQVQILRALGQLGDPGAVPEIEKRAVASFFSRPPRPVRIAAYKALSEIGTPHAVKLLEKALDDKDTEVRVAVRGMLKNLEEKDAGAPS